MIRTFLAAALLLGSTAITGTAAAADEPKAPDSTAEVTPAQKLSPYVQPGIVYIKSTWSARILDTYYDTYVRTKPFSSSGSCTGFVVTPDGYIATAGHCVNPADEKYDIDHRFDVLGAGVAYAGANGLYPLFNNDELVQHAVRYWKLVSPTSQYGDRVKYPALSATVSWGAVVSGLETSKAKPARVIDRSTFNSGDVALLKVEADGLNSLPLADERSDTGTDVASIGYPGKVDMAVDDDFTPSLKTGTVSSTKTVGSGTTSVYEIDAAVAPGMSGGPTVDFDGNVIGVNSFGAAGSESFNFVRPVSLIKEMLGDAGTEASQSPVTEKYVKGLDAYFAGDKNVAVKNLTAVVEEQPANGFAADYLKKAKALPDPKVESEGSSGSTLLIVGAGAALLLLVLAGVVFALVRSRRKGGVPAPGQGPGGGPGLGPTPAMPPGPGMGATAGPPGAPGPMAYPPGAGEATRPLVTSGPPPSGAAPSGPSGSAQQQAGRASAPAGFAPTTGPAPGRPAAGPVTGTATGPVVPRQPTSGPQAPASPAAPSGASPSEPVAGPQVTGSTDHQFCTACGDRLAPGMKFCGHCGTPV